MLTDKKLQSCDTYTMQPCNLNYNGSLKALAEKVLQNNNQCNSCANNSNQSLEQYLHNYGFTKEGLKNFLAEDWELYAYNEEALIAWANMLYERRIMESGKVPPDFISKAYCESCKQPVFLPEALAKNGIVEGCPWCSNKAKGLHIPQPIS